MHHVPCMQAVPTWCVRLPMQHSMVLPCTAAQLSCSVLGCKICRPGTILTHCMQAPCQHTCTSCTSFTQVVCRNCSKFKLLFGRPSMTARKAAFSLSGSDASTSCCSFLRVAFQVVTAAPLICAACYACQASGSPEQPVLVA